jgi:hypothetical protein
MIGARTAQPRGVALRPNKALKLTKLSAAPLLGRSAASCPRRLGTAGTASQLNASVRRTHGRRAPQVRDREAR